jgi:hypothetical protein
MHACGDLRGNGGPPRHAKPRSAARRRGGLNPRECPRATAAVCPPRPA